eukprot:802097-Rhodomonas_salina.1
MSPSLRFFRLRWPSPVRSLHLDTPRRLLSVFPLARASRGHRKPSARRARAERKQRVSGWR